MNMTDTITITLTLQEARSIEVCQDLWPFAEGKAAPPGFFDVSTKISQALDAAGLKEKYQELCK
jgi:hypothetical protein